MRAGWGIGMRSPPCLAGGLIGMGVDAATGAATDHKPNPLIVTLQPSAPPPRAIPTRKPRPPRKHEAGT